MSTKIKLTKAWQQISDGTKSCFINPSYSGYGPDNCEITFETALPAASVAGTSVGAGANLPATAEKLFARGSGEITVTLYTPK